MSAETAAPAAFVRWDQALQAWSNGGGTGRCKRGLGALEPDGANLSAGRSLNLVPTECWSQGRNVSKGGGVRLGQNVWRSFCGYWHKHPSHVIGVIAIFRGLRMTATHFARPCRIVFHTVLTLRCEAYTACALQIAMPSALLNVQHSVCLFGKSGVQISAL